MDWNEYFKSIKPVCPWSWASWSKGHIEIDSWEGHPKDLGNLDARVYTAPKRKFRILKKIAKRMNDEFPNEEWLWSHPDFGNNSTEIPVLIQQDRTKLEQARRNSPF